MVFPHYTLCVLNPGENVAFDCGDRDLNEFFCEDSAVHQAQFLSKTYYWRDGNGTIVLMFSVCNDNIKFSGEQQRMFPERKRFSSYPAVKIARLGVNSSLQGRGIGAQAIVFLKSFFVTRNKTGCRYLTVDAYNNDNTLRFYQRNGFAFLREDEKNRKTRTMYFDLLPHYNALADAVKDAMGKSVAELVKNNL